MIEAAGEAGRRAVARDARSRAAALVGILAAIALGAGAVFRERLEWYDLYVEGLVDALHTRFPVHDARLVSDVAPYLGAAIVVLALVASRRRGARPRELVAPLAALAVALLFVECLKLGVSRERPFSVGPVQHDSFPSGDAAQVALCVATALHLLALRRIPRDWFRPGMAIVGSMIAVAIALSRVYLNRHWMSDVGASLLLGLLFWSVAPRCRGSVPKLGRALVAIVITPVRGAARLARRCRHIGAVITPRVLSTRQ